MELFVILERTSVEAFIPGAFLFGVKRGAVYEDDGDSSVATTSINLTESNQYHKKRRRAVGRTGALGDSVDQYDTILFAVQEFVRTYLCLASLNSQRYKPVERAPVRTMSPYFWWSLR